MLQTGGENPWISADSNKTYSVAWGDVDGDGDLDLAAGDDGVNRIYLNGRPGQGLANNAPALTVTRPVPAAPANYIVPPQIMASRTIPLAYTLFDPEGDAVGGVEAFYSLNGGGQWFPAVAASQTLTTHLSASPTGVAHTFTWDTFASGFFGRSDNVVVRLLAHSQPFSTTSLSNGTVQYTKTVAGPIQRAYASAVTFPFRVRGTQVRVYTETVECGQCRSRGHGLSHPRQRPAGRPPLPTAARPMSPMPTAISKAGANSPWGIA